ncbi:MAG: reverse transcriptase/maturase family protein [Candidatus Pacebacteria bacterium]|nr:reverse transcriptase/maturase family protein [Candidatus Paceibacterota bacterium]
MKVYRNLFESIISTENLFEAWDVFKRDKRNRPDVERFEKNIEQEVFNLSHELRTKTYWHGSYYAFLIRDPKLRNINKATVRDRVLHHAIFKILNPIFEPTFILTSFSCRIGKGTHKGVEYLANSLRAVSQNNIHSCFALKCDVRKFFDSIDHETLLGVLRRRILDEDTLWLLDNVINSYETGFTRERERERESKNAPKKGVPIGNLTSQLFANIYMNELDQFVKHELRVKYYARYTDDFVILSDDRAYLESLIPQIAGFLKTRLSLSLHPDKVFIRKYNQGIDFLGYVILPKHVRVRTQTRRRIFKKMRKQVVLFKNGIIGKPTLLGSLNSYLGVLSHADAYELSEDLKNQFWFWMND